MYWADNFATKIIKSKNYQPYWVDDMKTPSGRVHIGSVRAVLTHDLLFRALKDQGADVQFSYVLEDHDPLDKLPHYIDQEKFSPHLGKPLYKIPSPEKGYESYGHRWGQEYIDIFNAIGAHPQVIWGSKLYLSGKMNQLIISCLDNADKIRHIYQQLYDHHLPSDWYPLNAVCQHCGKLSTTTVTAWDGSQVTYTCHPNKVNWTDGCGHQGQVSPLNGNAKLPWKVEWPCKWKVIGITIEAAGKDHMTDGGSHDFAKLMCRDVIDYPVPFHFSHEFFLIGGRKMSSSKGTGSSAKEISQIIPPYLIRFLVTKTRYNRAINFDPQGDTIPDLFDQYDQTAQAHWNQSDPKLARIFELSQVEGKPPKKHFLPRFRDIAKYLQDPKVDIPHKFAQVKGSPLTPTETKTLNHRIKYARIWLQDYAPQTQVFTIDPHALHSTLSSSQIDFLSHLVPLLEKSWNTPDEFQQAIYQLTKDQDIPSKEAFSAIYQSLINKNHGPKAAWFLLDNLELARKRLQQVVDQA